MVKSKIYKNIDYTGALTSHSKKKLTLNSIVKNRLHFPRSFRSLTFFYCSSRFKHFPSFYKATCFITGRSRGTMSILMISRLTFKDYAIKGFLTGFRLSRW